MGACRIREDHRYGEPHIRQIRPQDQKDRQVRTQGRQTACEKIGKKDGEQSGQNAGQDREKVRNENRRQTFEETRHQSPESLSEKTRGQTDRGKESRQGGCQEKPAEIGAGSKRQGSRQSPTGRAAGRRAGTGRATRATAGARCTRGRGGFTRGCRAGGQSAPCIRAARVRETRSGRAGREQTAGVGNVDRRPLLRAGG